MDALTGLGRCRSWLELRTMGVGHGAPQAQAERDEGPAAVAAGGETACGEQHERHDAHQGNPHQTGGTARTRPTFGTRARAAILGWASVRESPDAAWAETDELRVAERSNPLINATCGRRRPPRKESMPCSAVTVSVGT